MEEKKKEIRYPEGSIVACPCGKGYCVAADVKLLKTRQTYSELEIIRLKKVLAKCLKVNLEETGCKTEHQENLLDSWSK